MLSPLKMPVLSNTLPRIENLRHPKKDAAGIHDFRLASAAGRGAAVGERSTGVDSACCVANCGGDRLTQAESSDGDAGTNDSKDQSVFSSRSTVFVTKESFHEGHCHYPIFKFCAGTMPLQSKFLASGFYFRLAISREGLLYGTGATPFFVFRLSHRFVTLVPLGTAMMVHN